LAIRSNDSESRILGSLEAINEKHIHPMLIILIDIRFQGLTSLLLAMILVYWCLDCLSAKEVIRSREACIKNSDRDSFTRIALKPAFL